MSHFVQLVALGVLAIVYSPVIALGVLWEIGTAAWCVGTAIGRAITKKVL